MRKYIKEQDAEEYLKDKVWVASHGGVASEYLRTEVLGIRPEHKIVSYTGRPYIGAVAHYPHPVKNGPQVAIYVYGDIFNSILSQVKRHPDNAGKLRNNQDHVIKNVLHLQNEKDAFSIESQLKSFHTNRVKYPIVLLNYEKLNDDIVSYVASLFDIPKSTSYIQRKRTTDYQKENEGVQKVLQESYGKLSRAVHNLPSIIIRYPKPPAFRLQNRDIEDREILLSNLQHTDGKRVKHTCFIQDHVVYNTRNWFGTTQSGWGKLFVDNEEVDVSYCDNDRYVRDPEDNRVFEWNGEPYIIFNAQNTRKKRSMYIYNIDKKVTTKLKLDKVDNAIQKNWIPLVVNGELYFIYSFTPFTVIKLISEETGECKLVKGHIQSQANMKGLYGSTPLIPWNYPYYIGFLHSRLPHLPYSVIVDTQNWKVVQIGKQIQFEKPEEAKWDNRNKGIIQFPYDLKVKDTDVRMYIDFQDHCPTELKINFESFCKEFSIVRE